ncbi:hypothetical protein PENTCL1PPCAC_20362, partial [Pristionchus entomophagus]
SGLLRTHIQNTFDLCLHLIFRGAFLEREFIFPVWRLEISDLNLIRFNRLLPFLSSFLLLRYLNLSTLILISLLFHSSS